MWVPAQDEAVEMFARHFEAFHRSGSAKRARETAAALKANGDHGGHKIWNDVADTIDRLRQKERIAFRRQIEMM
jgi:predicted phage gp36 major capsid-like protein